LLNTHARKVPAKNIQSNFIELQIIFGMRVVKKINGGMQSFDICT
jgi:hypothetical protein